MKLMYSTQPEISLFKELSESILIHKSQNIIIFLCGGSTVNFYKYFVEKFDSFKDYAKSVGVNDFSNITFALTDDRWFSDLFDSNINFNQIKETGFYDLFSNLGAKYIKMSESEDMHKDAENYSEKIKDLVKDNYKILIGGVGLDGHTCGILPQESEEKFEKMYGGERLAVDVEVNNVHKDRITITQFAITHMDECFLYITSQEKKPTVDKLLYEEIELWKMPSQIYKKVDNVKIFTDII